MAQSTLARRDRTITVRATTKDEHLRYVEHESRRVRSGNVSFLQCPSWAAVKAGWSARFLGWFDGAVQVGGALVLCRYLPGTSRFFGYVPEGPVLDWARHDSAAQLDGLVEVLADAGAFAVRIGPPLDWQRWRASKVKDAAGPGRTLTDVPPDDVDATAVRVAGVLTHQGWRRCNDAPRGGAQPRFLLTVPLDTADDPWHTLSQGWRRNIRRAQRDGVHVSQGGHDDIGVLADLVSETEQRQRFSLGRSASYYSRQYRELNAEAPGRMQLYVAGHGERIVAAHTLVTLGHRAWYLTGGSSSTVRSHGSGHLLQWRLIEESRRRGVRTYDMRGVPTTLDPAAAWFGLLRWKLGTGGVLTETLGEWEITMPGMVNRMLHSAVQRYLAQRRV